MTIGSSQHISLASVSHFPETTPHSLSSLQFCREAQVAMRSDWGLYSFTFVPLNFVWAVSWLLVILMALH